MKVAIVNQKGGTGKTTTALSLAKALADLEKKVLLIDLDPQGNLSYWLGIEPSNKSITELFFEETTIDQVIIKKEGMDIIPSDIKLADVELNIIEEENREFILKKRIDPIKDNYDFIIMDCSPSLSLLTVNALCLANKIIVPTQLSVLGISGIDLIIDTVSKIKKSLNPDIEVLGVLPVMVDFRKNLSKEILNLLNESYELNVFESGIRSTVKVAEAPSFGVSLMEYAPYSKSALDYKKLAKEIIYN